MPQEYKENHLYFRESGIYCPFWKTRVDKSYCKDTGCGRYVGETDRAVICSYPNSAGNKEAGGFSNE